MFSFGVRLQVSWSTIAQRAGRLSRWFSNEFITQQAGSGGGGVDPDSKRESANKGHPLM